jgi:hypothetical protein
MISKLGLTAFIKKLKESLRNILTIVTTNKDYLIKAFIRKTIEL